MAKPPKNIAIWGMGQEGQAGLSYLQGLYPAADFTVIDQDTEADFLPDVADGRFDLIFKSPGVSLYKPELQQAMVKGTPVTSGTNLWFEAHPDACVIAVTGTKGKSTTAALIHHMLQKCGIHSVLAGNIGKPLLEVKPSDVTVVELSSFQTADLQYYPEIAVLTNLYEAHLEWHGGREQYHKDKMHLFDLSEETTAIVSKDDESAKKYLGDRENVVFYGAGVGDLMVPQILNKPHNLKNISAAMTALETLNVLGRLPVNALDDFKPLPHRQEIVGERDGVIFVNDSISTVPETVVAALESFADNPVALIIGGEEKNQNYSVVNDAIKKHGKVEVFCVPDSGARLAKDVMNAHLCKDLEEAVMLAQGAIKNGGYVLLSPGTPSFPIYRNYVERGEHFCRLCGF